MSDTYSPADDPTAFLATPVSGDKKSWYNEDDDPTAFLAKQPESAAPAPYKNAIDFDQEAPAIRTQIDALPEQHRVKAMNQWQDRVVADERASGVGGGWQDTMNNLARGTVASTFLDEARGGAAAATGGRYDEAKAYQEAINRATDKDSTKLGTLPLIGDVTVGGLTKLAGGVLSAPLTPMVRVAQGITYLPRLANAMVSGGLWGAAVGAGEGDTLAERGVNTAIGATIGTAGGGALPTVGAALGNTGRVVGNAYKRATSPDLRPAALRPYDRKAVEAVSKVVQDDMRRLPGRQPQGRTAATNLQARQAELGDEGMVADLGTNTRTLTEGLVSKNSQGRTLASDALEQRRGDAQGRIDADITGSMGPRVNTVELAEAARLAANREASPYYEMAIKSNAVQETPELAAAIARAEQLGIASSAMRRAQGKKDGYTYVSFLNYLKRAADKNAKQAALKSGDKVPDRDLANEFQDIAKDIKSGIDNQLSPGSPGLSSYAVARQLASTGQQIDEGITAGSKALTSKMTPDQLKFNVDRMRPGTVEGHRLGVRDDIWNKTRDAKTKWGPNTATKGRQILGSENARQKLGIINPQNPRGNTALIRRLDREADFDRTYTQAKTGSPTAARIEAQKLIPNTNADDYIKGLGNKTAFGVPYELFGRVFKPFINAAMKESDERTVVDMAKMLTAQGHEARSIAQALVTMARSQGMSAANQTKIDNIATAIARGMGPTIIQQGLMAPNKE